MEKQPALICYVPVLHDGYRRFFEKYRPSQLYILGKDLITESEYLRKEIRALDPELVRKSVEQWKIVENVSVLDKNSLADIQAANEIIAPREDAMVEFFAKYFPQKKIIWDDIFLRWDKHNTVKEFPVSADIKISQAELDQQLMLATYEKSKDSSDWWRRVGAAIIKDGEIIISACNQHVPSAHMPYVNGDPRSCFHKGMHLELSTAIHAEAATIAQAAKNGTSLAGASIYVTHFPCPPCAKLVAYSGIKKLYYTVGYGVLDGESILKSQGVEIIFVDVDLPQEKGIGVVEYGK